MVIDFATCDLPSRALRGDPSAFSLRRWLHSTSSAVTPATAAVAKATRPFCVSSDMNAAPRSERSSMSPATRAFTQPAGRCRDRMPTPVAISRMPIARIRLRLPASSLTPISLATPPGVRTCANPSPMLNQPSPLANRSSSS
jgi:hypothetical protein